MLHEFLTRNKDRLVDNCAMLAGKRSVPRRTPASPAEHAVPVFLDQVIQTLQLEEAADATKSRDVSGTGDGGPGTSDIGGTAAMHGNELMRQGLAVDQVVHDYGDVCQAITTLAADQSVRISVVEFRTLNRCLDNAIAAAVTEHQYQFSQKLQLKTVTELNEQLGMLAHELRNHLNTATLAIVALKAGYVGIDGPTGATLSRALLGLRTLIDRSLADVRVSGGLAPRLQQISLADFIADTAFSASLEAASRECHLVVLPVDASLAINADREMLYSAVGNLLTNAFKFTRTRTEVTLRAYAAGDRILIEVKDHCGGLPAGGPEQLFVPFRQNSEDRTGLGLGLAICRRGVEANGGTLTARDQPGEGCVFTIDLPRSAPVA